MVHKTNKLTTVFLALLVALTLAFVTWAIVQGSNSRLALPRSRTIVTITVDTDGHIRGISSRSNGGGRVSIQQRGNYVFLNGEQIHPLPDR